MNLSFMLMVSLNKRDYYDVFVPNILTRSFRGLSLAELLDDVALHLMETIPQSNIGEMSLYQFCPNTQLRKLRISVTWRERATKEKRKWTGRVPVVLRKWPEDDFYVVCVPRLGIDTFAINKTSDLEKGLIRFLTIWITKYQPTIEFLDDLCCRSMEFLEILDADVELPTILPSRPAQRKKKKKKKKKDRDKNKKREKRKLVAPVTLREVGLNLTHRAIDGRLPKTFGRKLIIEQILQQLKRERAAILLVGPSGVGKTAIVHEVVRRLYEGSTSLQDRSDVWEVDGNRIISGMSHVGAWEQRCHSLVHEANMRQDLIYVNDLPSLVYTGRSAQSDTHVAGYLEAHIARGEIQIIGECTPERLEATREEAPGFFSRFRVIQIPEMSERESLLVLVNAVRQAEAEENLVVHPEALESILAITRRFQVHYCYPGKAISLLRQVLGDYHREPSYDSLGRRNLDRESVVDFFARQTGLPEFILWEKHARKYLEIRAYFDNHIIAQEKAVDAVTDVVSVLQQGLNDPERPLATMLFVGPTGVGKTETAKALAMYLFSRKDRLIRFDMSEFMDAYAVNRLIGDRFQPEGELTRKIQQQPFSIILFDEIEKAHPSIFDALLQVLGEGRLTNAAGRTVDFCNTVVIMTSNLGVREANQTLGFAGAEKKNFDQHYRKSAEGFFRPEFFNRIDRVVPFRSLDREAIAPLVRRLLQELLSRRGLRHSSVMVRVDPALVELLIDQGFEPRYGARSMKRLLEQRLTVPLARHLAATPLQHITMIQLFRSSEEIDMEIWSLPEQEYECLQGIKPFNNWKAMQKEHDSLVLFFKELSKAPEFLLVQKEHTELLARFNQSEGFLRTTEQERLVSLGSLLDESRSLRISIEQFNEDFLGSFHFFLERDVSAWDFPDGFNETQRRDEFVTEVPVRVNRGKLFPEARGKLEEYRLSGASLLYRFRAFTLAASRPVLLRFLPGSEDEHTARWSFQLACHFASCWRAWASIELFVLKEKGWEQVPNELSTLILDEVPLDSKGFRDWGKGKQSGYRYDRGGMAHDSLTGGSLLQDPVFSEIWCDPKSYWFDVRAAAVSFTGPGLLPLLKGELGFFTHVYHLGPDRQTELVRVEEIGQEELVALDCLEEKEREHEVFWEKRRKGIVSENPRPKLPVRRLFRDYKLKDQETGEELVIPSLAYGLHQVAFLRLLSDSIGKFDEK